MQHVCSGVHIVWEDAAKRFANSRPKHEDWHLVSAGQRDTAANDVGLHLLLRRAKEQRPEAEEGGGVSGAAEVSMRVPCTRAASWLAHTRTALSG
jgi:hypothetical protein